MQALILHNDDKVYMSCTAWQTYSVVPVGLLYRHMSYQLGNINFVMRNCDEKNSKHRKALATAVISTFTLRAS